MDQFSHVLASGKVLSRTNFYKTILHRFMDLGLIAEQLEYDYKKHDSVKDRDKKIFRVDIVKR